MTKGTFELYRKAMFSSYHNTINNKPDVITYAWCSVHVLVWTIVVQFAVISKAPTVLICTCTFSSKIKFISKLKNCHWVYISLEQQPISLLWNILVLE